MGFICIICGAVFGGIFGVAAMSVYKREVGRTEKKKTHPDWNKSLSLFESSSEVI